MAFHETIAADEAARFAGYARELVEIQRTRTERYKTAGRGLHLKRHLGAVGTLVVNAPENSRVGVFANNDRTWPVYARFSNAASDRQSDKLPDARGFAIKLVGVPGKKLIPGMEDAPTQDFLLLSEPAIPFRNPDEFMAFVRAAKDGPLKLLPRLFSGFGFVRAFSVIGALATSRKVSSFAVHDFHTAAPISWGGASAAKLGLFPLASPDAPRASGDDYLRADLVKRLQAGPISWAVRAQFFVDDATTPIEDTSVVWSGPWTDLGTLTLPKQDPESAQGREIDELVERLSFDPWHAIEEHRPLGAIMRARAVAYGPSIQARNGGPEPSSVLGV